MFTLEIVLLVVVVIVGLGAGVVVTSRRSRSSTVEADVERVESREATVSEGVEELAEGFAEGLESDLAEQVEEVLKDVVVPAPPTFKERLGKARGLFTGVLTTLRSGAVLSDGVWDELEEALIRADVGVATTDALLADLRKRVATKELTEPRQVVVALRSEMVRLLSVDDLGDDLGDGEGVSDVGRRSLRFDGIPGTTDVWLFVGVNGVGKTTTVGKVARQQAAVGRSVLLAAGDTFRAAAGEQLAMWAERSGAEIVRGAEGGDPSAIVFDSVQRASARGNDLVLADTAGRLHTKVNLVEELKKIRRVADRPPGRVTEVLLVLDATTGQNALNQAREFTEAVEVTGVVLTKLDGTAKGGVVIAIQRELGIPVKMVGLGEGPDDLVAFDPEAFVDALFD
ncbi:MAG: signal recognition particle-docking protein FtsY [Acidimicrobiales bacterium]